MNNEFSTLLSIAAVLISCQQEPDSPSKANPGTSFTVTAAQGCPDWNAGDSLSVVDNTGGHLFKAESAGRTAVFKGKSYASAEQRVFLSPYSKPRNRDSTGPDLLPPRKLRPFFL